MQAEATSQSKIRLKIEIPIRSGFGWKHYDEKSKFGSDSVGKILADGQKSPKKNLRKLVRNTCSNALIEHLFDRPTACHRYRPPETLTARSAETHTPRKAESNPRGYWTGQKQTDNTDNTDTPEATNPRPISDTPRRPRLPR